MAPAWCICPASGVRAVPAWVGMCAAPACVPYLSVRRACVFLHVPVSACAPLLPGGVTRPAAAAPATQVALLNDGTLLLIWTGMHSRRLRRVGHPRDGETPLASRLPGRSSELAAAASGAAASPS